MANPPVPIAKQPSYIAGEKSVSCNAIVVATAIARLMRLTGTPLARLRHKDKWFEYEQAMIQGLSIRKSADSCKIAKNTSFKWRHRFLQIPATDQPGKMNGVVEADETYFVESFKGQRRLSRSARKRGGKAVKKGASKEQVVRDRLVKLPTLYYVAQVLDKSNPYLSPC